MDPDRVSLSVIDAGLQPSDVKSFYDCFGTCQDYNQFYELDATQNLVSHLFEGIAVGDRVRVLEIGCGTGSTAEMILNEYSECIELYHLVDISSTMVRLTRERLVGSSDERGRFADQVLVEELNFLDADALPALQTEPYDIILAAFVFDAISSEGIRWSLSRIRRDLLKVPGGKFGVNNLTKGIDCCPKVTTSLWECCYGISPKSMGGCRPLLFLEQFVDDLAWDVLHHRKESAANMVTTEVTVLRPVVMFEEEKEIEGEVFLIVEEEVILVVES